MEPSSAQPPADQLAISHDRHFALHGGIWLLVVVLVFALFFAYILFFPRLRCRRRRESEEASDADDIPRQRNCPLMALRKGRRVDEDEAEEEEQYSIRINEKFPHL
ncbi:hypothetical protein DITRI_Ditri05aG0009000 [Diplodiscus trichospermus]